MKKYPWTTITIEGHTDNVGRDAYNIKLSRKRAKSVKRVLVNTFDIDMGRIETIGYGPKKPIADNSNAAGRQKNRRIQAVIETITKD